MKAFLMSRDCDFDPEETPPPGASDLVQDLELETLFGAMAGGDAFLLEVARRAVLSSLGDAPAVLYRQEILKDCIKNAAIVRGLYDLAGEAIEREKKNYWGLLSRHPSFILHRSVDVLRLFVEMLRRLRHEAETHAKGFQSEGFRALFAALKRELDDDYLCVVEAHLSQLKLRRGVLLSAGLGKGNTGIGYVLRKRSESGRPRLRRLLMRGGPAHTFYVAERDEAGARALSELKDKGISIVANALAQSNDHILSFFRMLRAELAFYVGCLNLHEKLAALGEPISFPQPAPCGGRRHHAFDLYDVCLALASGRKVVGNDLDADGNDLVVVTGANEGGKSTFLRSIGLSQVMMQCGMFVPARAYSADMVTGLFTHFRREEDAAMRAGKLEEELQRTSGIAEHLSPNALVLFNESFQSTNEREGSEIARQIIRALLESGVKVFFVTHLYDLARGLREKKVGNARFLRAERREDGTRTFKIIPGLPLPTSYGKDLYDEIFRSQAADPSGVDEREMAGLR